MAEKIKSQPGSKGEATVRMGRHFARISRAPLKEQDSSLAWNERQRRLSAGYDAAKLLIKGTIAKNKEKEK